MYRQKITAQTIALTGLLSAVALVLLLLGSLIPVGWIGVTAVAGLAVGVAVSASGYLCGVLCYAVSGLLSLILLPAKQVSILFLCLFGLYPLVKSLLERLKVRVLEHLLKLAFFDLVLMALYRLCYQLFFQAAVSEQTLSVPFVPLLFVVGSVVFLLYDYAFSRVMALLQSRLVPELRRRSTGRR